MKQPQSKDVACYSSMSLEVNQREDVRPCQVQLRGKSLDAVQSLECLEGGLFGLNLRKI